MKLNIQLICNDIELYNCFNQSGLFNIVKVGGSLDLTGQYENLVLSDRIVGYNDLLNHINNNQLKAGKVFYLLSYAQNESQFKQWLVHRSNQCISDEVHGGNTTGCLPVSL